MIRRTILRFSRVSIGSSAETIRSRSRRSIVWRIASTKGFFHFTLKKMHTNLCWMDDRFKAVFIRGNVSHRHEWPGAQLAEGEGFEPPVPFRAQRFSRPPVSTAHPSLRGRDAIRLYPEAGSCGRGVEASGSQEGCDEEAVLDESRTVRMLQKEGGGWDSRELKPSEMISRARNARAPSPYPSRGGRVHGLQTLTLHVEKLVPISQNRPFQTACNQKGAHAGKTKTGNSARAGAADQPAYAGRIS